MAATNTNTHQRSLTVLYLYYLFSIFPQTLYFITPFPLDWLFIPLCPFISLYPSVPLFHYTPLSLYFIIPLCPFISLYPSVPLFHYTPLSLYFIIPLCPFISIFPLSLYFIIPSVPLFHCTLCPFISLFPLSLYFNIPVRPSLFLSVHYSAQTLYFIISLRPICSRSLGTQPCLQFVPPHSFVLLVSSSWDLGMLLNSYSTWFEPLRIIFDSYLSLSM